MGREQAEDGGAREACLSKGNRRHERYRVRLRTEVIRGKSQSTLFTEDVSFKGLFLRTDDTPPMRQLIQLKVHLPPPAAAAVGAAEVPLHGMAVHLVRRENGQGRVPGMGVQFFALDGEHGQRWQQFVRWLKTTHPESVERTVILDPPDQENIRRQFTRHNAALRVDVRSRGELHALYTKNISKGGMFLKTEEEWTEGTTLTVDLVVEGVSEKLSLDAVVRRREAGAQGNGIGVEFVGLSDALRERLFELISDDIEIDLDDGPVVAEVDLSDELEATEVDLADEPVAAEVDLDDEPDAAVGPEPIDVDLDGTNEK